MLKFEKVKISNFMSIGEAEVKLDMGGFILISAENHRVEDSAQSNGSGKSSIGESIVWALTGETIRGHKEVVNRYTTGNCSVTLFFEFKGHKWVVERRMSRTKEKSLEIVKDCKTLPAKGYRDAQEVLSKELPELTFKFINSVIILGQGLPGRFTNNSPSGRKAVLEELTNADFMINHVKESIAIRKAKLSAELRMAEDSRLADSSTRDRVKDEIQNYEDELQKLSKFDISFELQLLEKLKVEGQSQKLLVESLFKVLEESSNKVSELQNQSKSLKEQYASRISALTQETNNKIISERRIIESNGDRERIEIDKWQAEELSKIKEKYLTAQSNDISEYNESIREISNKIDLTKKEKDRVSAILNNTCPTCGQRMPGVTEEMVLQASKDQIKISEEISSLEDERDVIKKKIDGILKITQSKIEEESDLIYSQAIDKKNKITEKVQSELESLKKLNSKLDIDIQELQSERDEKVKELDSQLSLAVIKKSEANFNYISENTKLEGLRNDYREKKASIDVYKSKVEYVENGLKCSKAKLVSLEEDIESSTKKVEDKTSRIEVVKKMETFASRDFRGILLEEVINRLDTILKGYSQLVYGNQLTKFYQDGNAIVVEFDGKEYESLSGGEQQKINVLLQLSLRDLIIELTGISGSFILLDEVFDGLDYHGCEKMINLFQNLDTSIFVITHHQELDIPYDYKIMVVKDENGVATVNLD